MAKIAKFWKNLRSISILYSVWKSLFINLVPNYSDFIWLFNILKLYFGSRLKKCQKLPNSCASLTKFCPSKISELTNFEFWNRHWDSNSEFPNSILKLECLNWLNTNNFHSKHMNQPIWIITLGKVDPVPLSSEHGGRKERLIDRCHQKSPLLLADPTQWGVEMDQWHGSTLPPTTIQLYSPTDAAAASASTVSWIQQLGWQHSGYRPDESGFQIKPISTYTRKRFSSSYKLIREKEDTFCVQMKVCPFIYSYILQHLVVRLAAKVNKGLLFLL